MPKDPDYDHEEFLDGCLPTLDRRHRPEPRCTPCRLAAITCAVLLLCASIAIVLGLVHALVKAF